MSTVKALNYQIGQSATATNNFTLFQPSTPDGTVRLGNGNAGSATSLLTLDSSGNLGIGNASPSTAIGGQLGIAINGGAVNPQVRLQNTASGTAGSDGLLITLANPDAYFYNYEAGAVIFGTNNSEKMRLTSAGYLGIGTSSPGVPLDVVGLIRTSTSGTNNRVIVTDGTVENRLGTYTSGDGYVGTQSNHRFNIQTNGSYVATFDTSGNLGLGVTPSAWSLAGTSALQVKYASILGYLNNAYIQSNAYFSSSWKYINSDYAQQYIQASGQHQWLVAPSGTAGSAISFTQAMTLTNAGYLLVGGTVSEGIGATIWGTSQATDSWGNLAVISNTAAAQDVGGSICLGGYDSGTRPTNFVTISGRKENGSDRAGYAAFATTNSGGSAIERMRLTSAGYLGIGTSSPGYTLDVTKAAIGDVARFTNAGASNKALYVYTDATYAAIATAANASGVGVAFDAVNNKMLFTTASTNQMFLDASGNLGLGVTPQAWSGWKALDMASVRGTHVAANINDYLVSVGQNCYYNGSNWIYAISSGQPTTRFEVNRGGFNWFVAPSGTAGNAISFTQAMTLDASGNLLVGITSSSQKLHLYGASSTDCNQRIEAQTGTNKYLDIGTGGTGHYVYGYGNYPLYFGTNNTERARIDSSGNLLVGDTAANGRIYAKSATSDGTTNAFYLANSSGTLLAKVFSNGYFTTGTAVASPYNNTTASAANMYVDSSGLLYRSTSSARYKNSITDAAHGLAEVLKLRPVTYKGNNDGDTVFGGLIAEEVHDAGLTEFVQYNDEGEPDALAYGNMVSLAFKAIQELHAEIAALKAQLR